jgi:hypothetical protein
MYKLRSNLLRGLTRLGGGSFYFFPADRSRRAKRRWSARFPISVDLVARYCCARRTHKRAVGMAAPSRFEASLQGFAGYLKIPFRSSLPSPSSVRPQAADAGRTTSKLSAALAPSKKSSSVSRSAALELTSRSSRRPRKTLAIPARTASAALDCFLALVIGQLGSSTELDAIGLDALPAFSGALADQIALKFRDCRLREFLDALRNESASARLLPAI